MNSKLSLETVTQMAVFLENRPGALVRVCEALAKAGINIHALTVSDTVDSVKEAFDVRRYFREYPWAALGASVGVGVLGGMALGSGARARGGRITELHSRGQAFAGAGPSHNGGGPGPHFQCVVCNGRTKRRG